MNFYSPQASRLIGAFVLCLCPSLFTSTAAKQPSQENPVRIENKTGSLTVVGIDKDSNNIHGQDYIRVKLRNDSDKVITSYLIATSKTTGMQKDYTFSESEGTKGILPAATEEWQYPPTPNMLKDGLVILAVLFADGTGDGDPQKIKAMQDQLYGCKLQISRILSVLDSILESPIADSQAGIDEMESRTLSLSTESEDGNESIKIGLHNQKENTLYEIKEIREVMQSRQKITIRELLLRARGKLNERLSRIHVAGPAV